MNTLTPAQKTVLQTWTEQRDSLLREIGNYSTELDTLQKSTKSEGLALADLHTSIAGARGRIAELDALETRYRGSLATDIAQLEVRKSRLEGECSVLDERIKGGSDKYEFLIVATGEMQSAHDTMKDQAVIVNRVVGEIIQTSQTHTSDMKTIMTEIKAIVDQVIEKGNENIAQANSLIETVPVFVAKLQKSIAIRRVYPKGHPNFVEVTPE